MSRTDPLAFSRTAHVRSAITGEHGFCHYQIKKAFETAYWKLDESGRPTEEAREAEEWIRTRTNWMRTGIIPPEDCRQEFPFTFDFCCQALQTIPNVNPDLFDPEHVRRHGLPAPAAVWVDRRRSGKMDATRRDRIHSRHHVQGLPDVYARWERMQRKVGRPRFALSEALMAVQ